MSANLLKLIGPGNLWAVATQVASILKMQAEDIVSLELWDVGVWVQIRHKKARVVSYRELPCWMPAIAEAIETSPNFDHLDQLEYALEQEFEKRTKTYSHAIKKEFQRLIKQRRNQLEAETYDRWQVELLAGSYHFMFRRCRCQADLDWAKAEFWKRHYWHFYRFPDLMQWLQQCWEFQRAHLQSRGAG
jgi:hypothetical protein